MNIQDLQNLLKQNFNRISVKENDNLIIKLFGSPLSSNYKYFIEQNKNKNIFCKKS